MLRAARTGSWPASLHEACPAPVARGPWSLDRRGGGFSLPRLPMSIVPFLAVVGASLLLLSPSFAQNTVITFEEPGLTAMSNSPGVSVPVAARLADQHLASRGVRFSSTGGFCAVAVHGGATPSVPNILGGTTAAGALAYAQPITIRFFDPADTTQPAVTDFFRVRGDLTPLNTGTGTVQAFAVDGRLLGSQTLPDVAPGMTFTLAFTAPGMHRLVITETSGTVGWDNVEFAPLRRAASYVGYGSGCPGSAGVPTLSAAAGSLPLPGTTFVALVAGVPAGVGLMVSGLSSTSHAGLPLPLDLAGIGMAGCQLHAEPLVLDPLVGSGTTLPWSASVPAGTALLGVRLFQQALVFDPTANAFGFVASNAAAATIGS